MDGVANKQDFDMYDDQKMEDENNADDIFKDIYHVSITSVFLKTRHVIFKDILNAILF
jgi:hypothetical protein